MTCETSSPCGRVDCPTCTALISAASAAVETYTYQVSATTIDGRPATVTMLSADTSGPLQSWWDEVDEVIPAASVITIGGPTGILGWDGARPAVPAGTSVTATVDTILDTIDAATASLCACGCGRALDASSQSMYFYGPGCQTLWTARRAGPAFPMGEAADARGVEGAEMRWAPDMLTHDMEPITHLPPDRMPPVAAGYRTAYDAGPRRDASGEAHIVPSIGHYPDGRLAARIQDRHRYIDIIIGDERIATPEAAHDVWAKLRRQLIGDNPQPEPFNRYDMWADTMVTVPLGPCGMWWTPPRAPAPGRRATPPPPSPTWTPMAHRRAGAADRRRSYEVVFDEPPTLYNAAGERIIPHPGRITPTRVTDTAVAIVDNALYRASIPPPRPAGMYTLLRRQAEAALLANASMRDVADHIADVIRIIRDNPGVRFSPAPPPVTAETVLDRTRRLRRERGTGPTEPRRAPRRIDPGGTVR